VASASRGADFNPRTIAARRRSTAVLGQRGYGSAVTQPEALSEQAPPIDGVHFVLSQDPHDEFSVDVVIVVGKRPTSAVLTDVLSDDLAELLNNAADRIKLA